MTINSIKAQVFRKRIIACIFLFSLSIWQLNAQTDLAWEFAEPPFHFYPEPLYFFNNTVIDSTQMFEQMAFSKEKSRYSGFGILPFGKKFKPEYLSTEYFELYGKALKKAKELNMRMVLYDEYGFPSGSAGAINGDGIPRFKLKFPGQTIKRLDKIEYKVDPEAELSISLPEGKIMAVVAFDTISFKRLNLKSDTLNKQLSWKAPVGNWKVMIFTCVTDGDPNVDYLDPMAVRNFIKMTHQAYYDRFEGYFGNTITGTFFDEPTLYRANGRIWTNDFNTKFKQKYGFNPDLYYPALWYHIGQETAEARNYLFGFRSELYALAYMKEINDWSIAHGVYATGHQDNEEILNPVSTSGDFMLWSKCLAIPGIDKIGGNRPTEKFYKLISSAAYNWDKTLVMSETYGAMGNISWQTIYKVAMEQFAKGINMLIPHAVWYDHTNVTFLPELSYRNPLYADSLAVFNKFLARMHLMMQNEGHPVCDIAVLYPIHTLQKGHYLDGPLGYYRGGVEVPNMDYVEVGEMLTATCGKDYMFLHPEVLDQRCSITGNFLSLNNENTPNNFSTLILPSCEVLSPSNLDRVQKFYESGGTIIFTTQLPSRSTIHRHDAEVTGFIESVFDGKNMGSAVCESTNTNGGKAFFIKAPTGSVLDSIIEKTNHVFDISISPIKDILFVHKIYNEIDIIYLCNLGSTDESIDIQVKGLFDFDLWDPHTGEIKDWNEKTYKIDENSITEMKFPLREMSSVFLVRKTK